MISITDEAKKKFLSILESEKRQGQSLRVSARRGMSPFSLEYGRSFVEEGKENGDDEAIDLTEFSVFVDPDSAELLEGAVVDYVQGLNESGFKITNPNQPGPPTPEGPLAEKIQHLIDSQINPNIASHGGFIRLIDLKDDVAYLQFGGGCQGCGMANVTLKQGVEVMLKEAVPELKGVKDITDHDSGTNPYYQ
jgi:Fe/S biogenesis protein NfuA